jgi:membrane dipeptidase
MAAAFAHADAAAGACRATTVPMMDRGRSAFPPDFGGRRLPNGRFWEALCASGRRPRRAPEHSGKMASMRNVAGSIFVACAVLSLPGVAGTQGPPADAVAPRAKQLHDRAMVVDSHDDTTQRLVFDKTFDIAARNPNGNVDIPRLREGGLDALFFSIWVPSDTTGPPAVKRAMDQIDAVREAVRKHPKHLMLATTAADIRRAVAERKIAALMGMEGGHMIDDDLGLLRNYAALGVRYLTLTHFRNNNWADSSTDKPAHNGLTGFGKDVVRELNRIGVMVDISHVADKTFYDALQVTTAPVIASHSSCRAIANHPRNMSDDMLRALAKNGGVVMINYHAGFLSEEFRIASEKRSGDIVAAMEAMSKKCGGNEACSTMEGERIDHEAMATGELPKVTWEKIIEHIVHAVDVAGIDHVGLGSDFDGATMPLGMEDASKLPKITDALLEKGYSDANVQKILGGNILRVMEQVERAAGPVKAGSR